MVVTSSQATTPYSCTLCEKQFHWGGGTIINSTRSGSRKNKMKPLPTLLEEPLQRIRNGCQMQWWRRLPIYNELKKSVPAQARASWRSTNKNVTKTDFGVIRKSLTPLTTGIWVVLSASGIPRSNKANYAK